MLCVSSVYLRDIANNFCNLALECESSECLLFLYDDDDDGNNDYSAVTEDDFVCCIHQ